MTPGGPDDGRTARRDRNREAVLDAVLDLFAQDALTPTAAQVAERSGVSLRSVYRYFDDTDELVRSAIERNLQRNSALFSLDALGEGPLEERIDRLVAFRMRLYERMAPLMRATVVHAGRRPLLAGRLAEVRALLADQVQEMFAPEFAALPAAESRQVAAVADQLCSFESLEHLRRIHSLSGPATRAALSRALRSLLD